MKESKKSQPFDYLQKLIIIGDSGVGKSNILLRYTEGKFSDNFMMTIGISYVYKVISVEDIKIKLQIWDTAGQDKYKTITKNYYRNAQGVLIVFALDCRQSFLSIRSWIDDLTQTSNDDVQIMIVGNKMDLINNRQVTTDQAKQLADHYRALYTECSAKSGQSVEELFFELSKRMKEKIIDKATQQSFFDLKPKVILDKGHKQKQDKCCSG